MCLQVCGVFLLFLSGAHTLIFWGLYCHPWLRDTFIAAYYLAAAGCVVGALRARTTVQRALPMLALFGVRLACLFTRALLNSGSQEAVTRYLAMEVCQLSPNNTFSSYCPVLQFFEGRPKLRWYLRISCTCNL
jgi:hypothetical protein